MLTSNKKLYSYRRAGRCAATMLLAVAFCDAASAVTIASSSPLPGGTLGQAYSYQFSATNAVGPVQWGIQSGSVPGLSLSTDGQLSGTPNTAGVFNINVQAIDIQAEQSTNKNFLLAISGSSLTIITAALPSGVVNKDYAAGLSASGGTGNYSWSLNGGGLPPGLALSGSGIISGVPTADGVFAFSVRVMDSLNTSATRDLSIAIGAIVPPPNPGPDNKFTIVSGCPTDPFAVNQPVDIPIQVNTTATLNYQILSPSWMRIEMVNGVAHAKGVAPASGRQALAVVVSDYLGEAQTYNCNFAVAIALTAPSFVCPAGIEEGIAVSITLPPVTGGQPPYRYSIEGPPWLKVQNTIGTTYVLTGTPPIGTANSSFPYTVTVQDAIGSTPLTLVKCVVAVVPGVMRIEPLTGSGCPVGRLLALKNFSLPLSVTGGAGGYQWTLISAPPGFQLSATTGASVSVGGVLPREGGTHSIAVGVTDKNGATAQPFTCEIDVLPALAIDAEKPTYYTGQNTSSTLSATGGQSPYTWTFRGPDFLSLSGTTGSSVTLSGIPPGFDPFVCSVTLTDAAGSEAVVFNCSGTPTYAPVEIHGTCPADAVTLESNFSLTLTASGGNDDYRWTARDLPSWLSAPAATGKSVTMAGSANVVAETPFTVELADTAGNRATPFRCTLKVVPPPIPPIKDIRLDVSATSSDLNVSIELASPAPVTLQGQAEVNFLSNAVNLVRVGNTDDRSNPEVRFRSNGETQVSFTVPKDATTVPLGLVSTGTVAGSITVSVTNLKAGGADVLGNVTPSNPYVIDRKAPVIDEVSIENPTASGFTVVVKGSVTSRAVDTMNLNFTPRGNAQLRNSSASVNVTAAFRDYFTSAPSRIGGGQFSVRVPVTIDGDANQIGGVSVRLSNASGDSNTKTVTR